MEKTIKLIAERLRRNRGGKFNFIENGVEYELNYVCPSRKDGISFPSLFVVPLISDMNNQIMLEANNMESGNMEELVSQGLGAGFDLLQFTTDNPCPIIIPLLPSTRTGPYYQHLSRESLQLSISHRHYRIDEQVVRLIAKVKRYIEKNNNVILQDKIFLNGYSSSGCFAQRFALIHPEMVDVACIGGAISDTPVLDERLGYPLGLADYYDLFGKSFDKNSYRKIKFRTYVGEKEDSMKSRSRVDEDGRPAPMHDMSYMERSIPREVGQKARELFGRDMFARHAHMMENQLINGVDIEHKIFEGRSHNNRSGRGVNELRGIFIKQTYNSTLNDPREVKRNANGYMGKIKR